MTPGVGSTLIQGSMIVRVLTIIVAFVIVGKALSAARQHESRAMALLAVGLVLLVFAPGLFELVVRLVFGRIREGIPGMGIEPLTAVGTVLLVKQLLELGGVSAILGSLYVRE